MGERALVGALLALTMACSTAVPADPFKGRYVVSGAATPIEVMQELTTAFTAKHPGMTWTFDDTGSAAAVGLVHEGPADIGMLSRSLTPEEAGTVEQASVGFSGTAVAVNEKNPVSGLTTPQIRSIFSGEVTDWSAVGGQPGHIFVLIRVPSATRTSFEAAFFPGGHPTYPPDAARLDVEPLLSALRDNSETIGYVPFNQRTFEQKGIKLLALDGVAPTIENLRAGTYKLARPLVIVYDPNKARPGVKAFFDFVRSADGQRIIRGS